MKQVTVRNPYRKPVPVKGVMLLPGEARQVPLWAAEAACRSNPDLEVDGEPWAGRQAGKQYDLDANTQGGEGGSTVEGDEETPVGADSEAQAGGKRRARGKGKE